MSDFHQIQLSIAREQSETISDYLFEQGALSVTIESGNDEQQFDLAHPTEPNWERQNLSVLFTKDTPVEAICSFLEAKPDLIITSVSAVENQDWERSWLTQFEPIQISPSMWVCPSWITPPDPDAVNLIIDPGLAFGTGTHATTNLCLQYLSRCDLKDVNVVDYGCGSGILAIAALALGAHSAIGVDVDNKALDASRENANINGVTEGFTACLPGGLKTEHFDVVIANILANTLIELSDEFLSRTRNGTLLILSGILFHQEKMIRDHYRHAVEFEVLRQGDWIVLAGSVNQR